MFFEWLCKEPMSPEKNKAVTEVLQDNKGEKNVIVTSVITHIECVPSKLDEKLPGARLQYDALWDGVHFVDYQISTNVLRLAREIRDYYFRPPVLYSKSSGFGKLMDSADAIHLATAIINGADEFHSRDDVTKGIKVPLVGLYEYSGKDKVCGKYPLKIVSPESPQGEFDYNGPQF